MSIKIIIIIGLVIILFACAFMYNYINKALIDIKPSFKVSEIKFASDYKLYLKSKVWGITNDKKTIALSTDSSYNFKDSTKDYIYPESDFLFYKIKNDSLYIYVYNKSKTPTLFKSNIKVKQVELENRDMMKLFHEVNNDEIKKFQ